MKPFALTIAGSDPSAGAGVQSDLASFHACGARGLSVITVVTAQTHKNFKLVYALPRKIISSQLALLLKEYPISAAKVGLLFKKTVVDTLMGAIKKNPQIKWIIDPIMQASLGRDLLQPKALSALKKLVGLCYAITPNLHEAGVLSQQPIHNLDEMKNAAKKIYQLGPKHVLIKGGHLESDPIDLLYDGQKFYEFRKPRISGKGFHGLGCRFSAALTAFLAQDIPLIEAIEQTEIFMQKSISSLVHELNIL